MGKGIVIYYGSCHALLLCAPNAVLVDWKAADLYEDDRLDVFDLCIMKREPLSND